jgi:hypothetical protein
MNARAALGATAEFRSTEIHSLLSNERRQHVIEFLRMAGGTISTGELAQRIAVAETGESPPPRNIVKSVDVALHQTHLPKLDDAELVAYHTDSMTVELLERGEEVGVYMETVKRPAIAWSEYYLGLSVLGLLAIIAAEVGVLGLAAVGSLWLAMATFAAVLVSAGYHTVRQGTSIIHRL